MSPKQSKQKLTKTQTPLKSKIWNAKGSTHFPSSLHESTAARQSKETAPKKSKLHVGRCVSQTSLLKKVIRNDVTGSCFIMKTDSLLLHLKLPIRETSSSFDLSSQFSDHRSSDSPSNDEHPKKLIVTLELDPHWLKAILQPPGRIGAGMLAVSDGVAAASSQPDSLKPDCSNQLIHAPSTDIASSVTFSPVPPELILGSSPVEAHFPTDINHPVPEIQITPPPSIRETSPPSASSGSGSWMAFTHPPPAVEVVRAALVESTRYAHKTNKHTANIKMIRKMVVKKLELPEDYFNDLEWKDRSTVIIEKAFKEAWHKELLGF